MHVGVGLINVDGVDARIVIAGNVDDVVFGELNTVRLPWSTHSFDVVLAETVFVNKIRIGEYLREGGIHIGNDQEETL